MSGRVVEKPSPTDIESLLQDSRRKLACVNLFGRCEVHYGGDDVEASLAVGDRIVLIKPDGSVIVHSDSGCDPVNWQPPGATVQTESTEPLVLTASNDAPNGVLTLTFTEIYHASLLPMDDDAELMLTGTEADLQKHLSENPDLIENGLRVIETERDTKSGPIDLWCRDETGEPVVVEIKRRTGSPHDVDQLRRYLTHIEASCRGILVAPSISDRAKAMLNQHGLEFQEVEMPDTGVERNRKLSEYNNPD